MKKITKKLLSLFLAAVMLFGAAPLAGFMGMDSLANILSTKAEAGGDGDPIYNECIFENYIYTVIDGEAMILEYTGTLKGEYTVPSYLNEYKVTIIGIEAFESKEITKLTVPEGVKEIKHGAFYNCEQLNNIILPESLQSIQYQVFDNTAYSNNPANWENGLLYVGNYLIRCNENVSTNVIIKPGTKIIAGYTFSGSEEPNYNASYVHNIQSISIPDSVRRICHGAFAYCTNLSEISIADRARGIETFVFYGTKYYNNPNNWDGNALYVGKHLIEVKRTTKGIFEIKSGTVEIAAEAFIYCEDITNISIPESVDTIGSGAFMNCSLVSVTIPDGVTTIERQTFSTFNNTVTLEYVHIPKSVTDISGTYYNGFRNYQTFGDKSVIICSDTEDCYAKTYAEENGLEFVLCNGHGTIDIPNEADIYNLGEETYSFANFGDNDSSGGHCFGMSVTSSAYYTKELDIASVGGNYEQDVYALTRTDSVKTPICYYQGIQESTRDKSMVAGGHYYSTFQYNINSDWNEVVNYVKNHNYDNKGTLQIGFRKDDEGGHAINFLYYAEVDGQQRIYAYDNNFPNVETYFYMDSNGNVMQAPYSTFSGAIDCIALRSVPKYFDLLQGFDKTRYIYADKDTISIEGSTVYALEGGVEMGERVMYEVPANVTQIKIKPLVDNAEFEYLDESYSFGAVDDDTVGVFTLATSDDQGSGSSPSFTIENEGKSIWDIILDFFKILLGLIVLPFSFLF